MNTPDTLFDLASREILCADSPDLRRVCLITRRLIAAVQERDDYIAALRALDARYAHLTPEQFTIEIEANEGGVVTDG